MENSKSDKDDSHESLVTRKIYFYKLEILKGEEDRRVLLNPWGVLRHFNTLPFQHEHENSRYVFYHPKRADVVLDVTKTDEGIINAIFGRITKENIPAIEKEGEARPIILEENEGLFVISHIQIHPDGTLLKESVKDGPSVAGLRRYIKKRNEAGVTEVNIHRIAHSEFVKLLPQIKEVRFLDIAVARRNVGNLESIDPSLAGLFGEARDWVDFSQYTFRGSMQQSKRNPPIMRRFLNGVREALIEDRLKKQLERLRLAVKLSEEERTMMLNLLDAHLNTEILVKRTNPSSRNTDDDDIFDGMKRIYNKMKNREGQEWLLLDVESDGTIQKTLDEN